MAVWPKERVVNVFFVRELWCYGVLSTEGLLLSWTQATCNWSCSLRHQNTISAIFSGGFRYLREMFTKARFGLGRMISLDSSTGGGGEQDPAGQSNPPMPRCAPPLGCTHGLHLSTAWHGVPQLSAPPSHSWPLEIPAKAVFGNDLSIQELLLERQFRAP